MNSDKGKQVITKGMTFGEILKICPSAAELMVKNHMHCAHCPAAGKETFEQGCLAHGLTQAEMESLLKEINGLMK